MRHVRKLNLMGLQEMQKASAMIAFGFFGSLNVDFTTRNVSDNNKYGQN